jgi:hypothetical protein
MTKRAKGQIELAILQTMHIRRGGLIGKVQAYIEAHPWKECGEVAKALGEWSSRVSNCLNKLKLEGNAQQRKGVGRSNKSIWAGTSGAGRERREAILATLEPQHDENKHAQAIARFSKAMRRSNRIIAHQTRHIGLAKLFQSERIEA